MKKTGLLFGIVLLICCNYVRFVHAEVPENSAVGIKVTNVDYDTCRMYLKVSNISRCQEADRVIVQAQIDDMVKTYEIESEKDGELVIDIVNFDYKYGTYTFCAYIMKENGKKELANKTTCAIYKVPSALDVSMQTITIEKLEHDYEFLFLSDLHAINLNREESTEEINYKKVRERLFVNSNKIYSEDTLFSWVSLANRESVDALLLGGDIIDSPSTKNISFLSNAFQKLKAPYLYTMGNHDWTIPTHYMDEYAVEEYKPLFKQFGVGDRGVTKIEYDDLMIVSVDDSTNSVSEETLEAYREIALEGKPIILMLHVPIAEKSLNREAAKMWSAPVTIGGEDAITDSITKEFIEEVLAKDSPVVAVLSGHVHFEDKVKLTDKITEYSAGAGYEGKAILFSVKGKH